MSRLTYEKLCEILQGVDKVTFTLTRVGEETHSSREVYEAIQELQHYKDLEEQGRLIELPCKVGDTVWVVSMGKLNSNEITRFDVGRNGLTFYHAMDGFIRVIEHDAFGKTVFLTKEEAEAKLNELKGE